MKTTIAAVHGRQILDSRGNPTVEVDVGSTGVWAAPPSRRAPRRACTRRSSCATAATPGGKGVTKAVANVNGEIAAAVVGLDAADQEAVDGA